MIAFLTWLLSILMTLSAPHAAPAAVVHHAPAIVRHHAPAHPAPVHHAAPTRPAPPTHPKPAPAAPKAVPPVQCPAHPQMSDDPAYVGCPILSGG